MTRAFSVEAGRSRNGGEIRVLIANYEIPPEDMGPLPFPDNLFSIPGIGQLLTQAVLNRDYPMVQGGLLITTALLVLVNIGVDLCYALLDPRIRYDRT